MHKIAALYPNGILNEIDGVAVDFSTWRFSIRTSNTEPLMRLNVEGDTSELVAVKLKELSDRILGFGAVAK
jgi:phosphomannomutase